MKFLINSTPMFSKPAAEPSTPKGPKGPAPKRAAAAEEDPVETAVDRLAKINPELAEKKRFLRDETARQEKRLEETGDSEHWFAVNAESRAQKEALLRALGLYDAGDKYLSALDVADVLARLLDGPVEARAEAAKALRALRAMPEPRWAKPKASKRLFALTK